ncbi:hypothetical protein [Lacticaseibacillus nasuensis]|uniref:Uncharacterized protein n=1 Tax=Lacticaseibacillus nasuensis JCM 17158 TaxID=1291734 RepID=A0A0R1JZH5_9LACO|nr:hypothetical protein [Lacticaseibacillus nasuensis]KRK74153.1 hypothetical protein FD02_GL000748 [Lacticaseibacillus nasuensis JCM 17158]MCX2455345.1 hypothetical protein [Lacticaseibacillus nasuensis]
MKISYESSGRGRLTTTVWHNQEAHELHAGESVTLKVHRGDVITWRVGKHTRRHTLSYQSPEAEFVIRDNRQLGWYLAAFAVLAVAVGYLKWLDNTGLTIFVLLALIGYEVVNYFIGWVAIPQH